jgi:hypothetical protein
MAAKKKGTRKQDPIIEVDEAAGMAMITPIVATFILHDLEDNAPMCFTFFADGDVAIHGESVRLQPPQVELMIATVATAHGIMARINKPVVH